MVDEIKIDKTRFSFTDASGVTPITKREDDQSKIQRAELTITNYGIPEVKFELVSIPNDGKPLFEFLVEPRKGKLRKVSF